MRPSAVVFAELKTETGTVRTEQHGWLSALRGCEGVEVRLWRPRDWQEIEEEVLVRRRRAEDLPEGEV